MQSFTSCRVVAATALLSDTVEAFMMNILKSECRQSGRQHCLTECDCLQRPKNELERTGKGK
jgi:hypothetical protein